MNHLLGLGLGGQEIWILLILILVLFGGKKIPELMRGVGRGVGELQKGVEEGRKSFDKYKTLEPPADDYRFTQDEEPVQEAKPTKTTEEPSR